MSASVVRSAAEEPAAEGTDEKDDLITQTWPVVVRLTVPIEFGKEHITELTFRRGRMGDVKGIKIGKEFPTETILLIASRLSGQPVGVIERLDQDDAGFVAEIALGFLGKCLSTGTAG